MKALRLDRRRKTQKCSVCQKTYQNCELRGCARYAICPICRCDGWSVKGRSLFLRKTRRTRPQDYHTPTAIHRTLEPLDRKQGQFRCAVCRCIYDMAILDEGLARPLKWPICHGCHAEGWQYRIDRKAIVQRPAARARSHTVTCSWCGKRFTSQRSQTFCTTLCLHRSQSARRKTRLAAGAATAQEKGERA